MASPRFNFAEGTLVNVTGSWLSTDARNARPAACPPSSPCLIDMTPQSGNKFNDAALADGQTLTEPFTGTRITVDSRTEATLTFTVTAP